VTLLIAVATFLVAQTPFQHVTVALFIVLYCAIRYVGLAVIERSELLTINAQQSVAELVKLRDERLRSRKQATVECGLLAVLGFHAALKVVAPSLLVGWP
jgi:C4-dicarboxylate transporter